MVGDLRFLNQNMFECVLSLQSRMPVGSQTQQFLRFSAIRGGLQIPGDFDQDGRAGLSDVTQWLSYLFTANQPALPCYDEDIQGGGNLPLLDANGSGRVDLADVVYQLGYLFLSGPQHSLGAECLPIFRCPTVCAP